MDTENLREEVLSRQLRFHGAIIDVAHWQVRLPDGSAALREVVLHPGAAAVVPVDAAGMVTLVRQHRVVLDEVTLEIPAGKLDAPGEDPLACARRELSEETGLTAAHWRHLMTITTTPGFCTERVALYLATGLQAGAAHLDEGEFLRVERMPLDEAVALVMAGRVPDGKTALGLLMASRILGGQFTI
ncbi:MAG: NUDIX hydrolase [Oscillospiraceae bacterium]|nr:NUDIX hydrolase [Oscillospiraceae bacterium]